MRRADLLLLVLLLSRVAPWHRRRRGVARGEALLLGLVHQPFLVPRRSDRGLGLARLRQRGALGHGNLRWGRYDSRMTPEFWPQAKRTLSRRDPVLRKLIKAYPDAELGGRGDAFQTLARSIVGQQISVKAA